MIQSEFRSGLVAQLVEQRTENPRVGGSIPSQATISSNNLEGRQEVKTLSPVPVLCPFYKLQG